jgi:hypothetical protein
MRDGGQAGGWSDTKLRETGERHERGRLTGPKPDGSNKSLAACSAMHPAAEMRPYIGRAVLATLQCGGERQFNPGRPLAQSI